MNTDRKILAVDNDENALYNLRQEIKDIYPSANIAAFCEVTQVLTYLNEREHRKLDYAFLDTCLRGLPGIELARLIREYNPKTKIIFCTEHSESTDEAKSDNFPNTYKAGELDVSKTVTGNLGDKNKYFEFKVTLTGEEGKTYRDSYAVTGGSNTENPSTIKIGEETTFLLKHGETIHIENLPYGVTYTVTETAADGYTTKKAGDDGTINAAEQTAAFTNTKNGSIDTGVVLNNMPYILVLAVLAAGVAVFIIRKRRED